MNSLVKELIRPLLEDSQKVTAVYGGGFKPPIKGHFNLVKQALKDFPEIDDFIIYVGGGVRDGITQEQSMAIWEVYKEVLGSKVQVVPSAQPIRDVMRYAKDHPDELVYFVIGYREGREDDLQDIASRTKGVEEKYSNLEVKVISTPDPEVSGTNARKAASKGDKERFMTFLPDEVPPGEKEEIYNIVDKSILKEHMAHTNTVDLIEKCGQLTKHMIDKGYKIEPLPGLKIIDDDVDNSQDFFGKTAYYNPNEQMIVLYTQGRHPKDIVRSYAHEMIHHIQNLKGEIGTGDIKTTNTNEDDYLEKIEREAYEEGNIAFRNWTDSLKENKVKDPFGLKAYAYELARLGEEEEPKPKKYTIFCDMDGVLVDFDEGYKQLTGMSTQHVNAQDKSNFWKAFRQGLVDKDISEESFWTNLDWQPGGKELWDYIAPYKPYVLTAPAVNFDLPDDQRYSQEYNESMKGKLNWVQRLPNMRKVYFAAAKNKPKFARPNHILIDDRKDTIDAWNANGGIGILYQSAQQVIDDLKKLGL